MLPLMMAFSGGMQIAGGLFAADAARQAAHANEGDARRNAINARLEAQDVLAQGQQQVADLRKSGTALKSQQIASYAAQGVDVGSDVSMAVQQDSSNSIEQDAQRLYTTSRKRAWGLTQDAQQSDRQAMRFQDTQRYAMLGGLLGAGSTAVNTGANIYQAQGR